MFVLTSLSSPVYSNTMAFWALSVTKKLKCCEEGGTAQFAVNNCLNTNIYSYLETSGGQMFNLYLNVINFFNTALN